MFLADKFINIVNTGSSSEIRIIYALKRTGIVLFDICLAVHH